MDTAMVVYEMYLYDHVMAAIVCVLAPVLAFTSKRISTEDIRLESEDKIRLYHSNALLLVVFALVTMTIWRIPDRPLRGLGFDLVSWHPYLVYLVLAIFLFYFLDIFLQYGSRRWRLKTEIRKEKALSFVPANQKELIHFLFLALAAGIGEEIIFRGYLINYLLHWTGNSPEGIITAVLFTSILFAFLHGYQGIRSIIKIFFVALLFCGIFILSHSLIIVIIIHALMDILSGIISVYFLKDEKV